MNYQQGFSCRLGHTQSLILFTSYGQAIGIQGFLSPRQSLEHLYQNLLHNNIGED